MQSNCIREVSRACSNNCCTNLLIGLPENRSSPSKVTSSGINPQHEFTTAILASIQPNSNFTNHESLPSSIELFSCLENAYPYYSTTVLADNIRAQEYNHIMVSNHVCLDYIGHGLFSYSQQQGHNFTTEIASSSTSNPPRPSDSPFFDISYKSVNLNSFLLYGGQESEFESSMRKRIMKFMNVSEEDYYMVFTANQSSAFKLLADSYPFQSNKDLLTVYDYENEAVQVMIESSEKKGARPISAVFSWPNLRVNSRKLRKLVVNKRKLSNRGLFAFPLQSRMTGARYSYQWMSLARENGWHILLDACALGPKEMETLGLSLFQPDFLICSFYKVFGENPSGFCCLFIKKSSVSELCKSCTSMGIVSLLPANESFEQLTFNKAETEQETAISHQEIEETPEQIHLKESSVSEIIELDETPHTAQSRNQESNAGRTSGEIECRGLDHADTLGLILISSRTRCLTNWLVNALMSLQHPHSENGLPLIRIYGPKIKLERGPAVAFNVYDWKGEKVDPALVQKLADRNNISVGCGILTNIWFSEIYEEEKHRMLETRSRKKESKKKDKNSYRISVVTISIGMLTNFDDMYRIWAFVTRFLDADFVEKERWRYTALNQTTVEV
ncbi:molybdenum cofactor sulfurase-like [Olea europaea subsp. europaea]|uniref:Molybdenum cofactor sulfurase-like n=1 Tax=Olea europaea subsp. europaea TaxID=158383 RepID=A0A8S0RL78_OLEEU|nr:molybdenum cofactor sulfurase-like [Olea europaea subsp. europaea]